MKELSRVKVTRDNYVNVTYMYVVQNVDVFLLVRLASFNVSLVMSASLVFVRSESKEKEKKKEGSVSSAAAVWDISPQPQCHVVHSESSLSLSRLESSG